MKRQGVGREAKAFSDLTGSHAFRPGLHKQTEDIETVILGERGQGRDSLRRFHISANIETFSECQGL